MDDTRVLTLTLNGHEIRATPLKPAQFTALQMMKHSLDTEERAQRANLRMYRILENAVGVDGWELLMDELASGDADNSTFSQLVEQLVRASVEHIKAQETKADTELAVSALDVEKPLTPEEIAAFERRMALLKGSEA